MLHVSLLLLASLLPARVLAQEALPTRSFDLLRNGDFLERYQGQDPDRLVRVPYWSVSRGSASILEAEGRQWLELTPGQIAEQPLAAWTPAAQGLILRGQVRGSGRLILRDGSGEELPVDLEPGAFEVRGTDLAEQLGRPLRPRFVLMLAARAQETVGFTGLEAWVELPFPEEAALRARILELLDEIFSHWLSSGRSPDSGFVHHFVDVVTGERLRAPHPLTGQSSDSFPNGLHPLFPMLMSGLEHHESETWRVGLEAFLADYFEKGLHADTGLPMRWSRLKGVPLENEFREVALDLRFLLDLAERGPEVHRKRAATAALRMGETILEHGVLPDGQVAARYRARDGATSLEAVPLRRLDVPAQLGRLGAVTGDERFTLAARNALAVFEYTHHWPGTWRGIDPGFDDDFGHYGARAVTLLEAHPGDAAFRGLVRSGWRKYEPLWRDALRFGGTLAADQIRCWRLLIDWSELEPELRETLEPLLRSAVRAHFHGQQYVNGAFGDVTFAGFDPKTGIEVGDLPGTPSNLMQGLGLVYRGELLGRDPELLAMFATLLETTEEHYRRPHGYLTSDRQRADANPPGGGIRLAAGLLEMLEALDR